MSLPGEFQTRFGQLTVAVTELDHAYVYGDSLRVNNVDWRVTAHLYKRKDGQWHIGTDRTDSESDLFTDDKGRTWKQRENLYVKKNDLYAKNREASSSVFDKVWDALTSDFRVWAACNERVFLLAEVRYRKDELARATSEVEEAEATLIEKQNTERAANVAYLNALAKVEPQAAHVATIFGLA